MDERDDGMRVKEDKRILERGEQYNENKDVTGEKWKIRGREEQLKYQHGN